MNEAAEKDRILSALPTGPPTATGFFEMYGPLIPDQLLNDFNKHRFRLEAEGYIGTLKGSSDDNFTMRAWRTAKGRDFLEHGGYTAEQEKFEQIQLAQFEKERRDVETKRQELITSRFANAISLFSLFVSAFSAYFSVIESNNNKDFQYKITRRVDSLQTTVDSLKRINSSLKAKIRQ